MTLLAPAPARTFGKVSLANGAFEIEAEPHVVVRLKRVFPKIPTAAMGKIRLAATDENAKEFLWFMERYPLDGADTLSTIETMAQRFERRAAETQAILSGNYAAPDVAMHLPPRSYQVESAMLAWTNGGLLVGDELGLGKTVSGITMLSRPDALPALVVVPPHLQKQWQREIRRFLPHVSSHIIQKGTPYNLGGFARPDILIITYHKLAGWANHLQGQVRSIIFDEAQELRHTSNNRWQAAHGLAESSAYRMGLTATPIYNYGDEFYNVLECIRPGALGERWEFLREWCHAMYNDKASIRDPRAFGSYLREMGYFIRRTRKEVGRELPPVLTLVEPVEADLGHIDQVKDAASELAKIILGTGSGFEKFQAGGELDYRLRQATGIAKAPYVAAFVRMLLEESDEPVILVGWHRAVYDMWRRDLWQYNPAWYTGEESPAAKEREKDRFLRGETRLLILSLRSGTGLDGLQEKCHRIVFGELDWSPAVHEQCIGRIYRDGQGGNVFAYYLVSEAGSDPVIQDVLGIKRGQLEGVRDPNATVLEQRTVDPDHIKKLAERFLSGRHDAARNTGER